MNFSMKAPLIAIAVVTLAGCASPSYRAPVSNGAQQSQVKPEATQMVVQVQNLQEEVRQLRNLVEQQQFEMDNIKQRQNDVVQASVNTGGIAGQTPGQPVGQAVGQQGQYGAATTYPPAVTNEANMPLPTGNQAAVASVVTNTGQVPAAAATAVVVNSGAVAAVTAPVVSNQSAQVGLAEQGLYDQGFEHLKNSNYNAAITSFNTLIAQYPTGSLADDALYWVGEANYVNREYAKSIDVFNRVIAQYPQSDRVPEALLKIGYVNYDMGAYDKAAVVFRQVVAQYPNHPVSASAAAKLQRIQN